MADYSFCFEFKILNGREVVKVDGFCIDAKYYLSQKLECDWEDVDEVAQRTKDKSFKSIAKWAASNCAYMSSVMLDGVSEIEAAVAQEISENLSKNEPDQYDEIYEEVYQEISHKLLSVKLIVDGKSFTGK
jgi:hypothetical protein